MIHAIQQEVRFAKQSLAKGHEMRRILSHDISDAHGFYSRLSDSVERPAKLRFRTGERAIHCERGAALDESGGS